MQDKPSLTIGVPAYNEEANIGYVFQSILNQKEDRGEETITVALYIFEVLKR